MGKPYSIDLRDRVVAAVETGGMSCHRAAAQPGVGVSTAILWVRRLRETGSVAPGQMGGHKPKAISGEHRAWLMERTQARDFHLARACRRTRRTRPQGRLSGGLELRSLREAELQKNRGGQRTRSPRRRRTGGRMAQVSRSRRA
jgi:transposase